MEAQKEKTSADTVPGVRTSGSISNGALIE